MSITDTHIISPSGPVSLEAFTAETPCGTDDVCSELSKNTRIAALSSIMPRLRTAMELVEAPRGLANDSSGRVLEMLSGNIALLQDTFMHTLSARLHSLGVDTSSKLTLRLNDDIRLVVAGEHPDTQTINELLANDAELVAGFVEIAAQSAALRDLRSLRTLTLYDHASDAYSALAAGPGECTCQLSLKGEMSHFYFTR